MAVVTNVLSVAGRPTKVLQLGARGPPRLNVLIIPGNPGIADFYLPFMHRLHDRLEGQASVTCTYHLGMDGQGLTTEDFTLEHQVQHKADLMREHFGGQNTAPLVVLAHSIGAYMAIKAGACLAVSTEPGPRLLALHALYPFLEVNRDCKKQQLLKQLTGSWHWISRVLSPIQYLPAAWINALVTKQSGIKEQHALEATRALLRPAPIRCALHLGACEFRDLQAPAPWDDMRSLERLHVYVTSRDVWCPDGMCQRLDQELPEGSIRRLTGQEHAFCVFKDQSIALADSIVEDWSTTLSPDVLSVRAAA